MLGAGDRGASYARLTVKTTPRARVVAVAEPREEHRRRLAALNDVADSYLFDDWSEALERERLADAVIIALPDRLHDAAALTAIAKGYHVLLEAPMATSLADCRAVADAAAHAEGVVAVGHVLRYADDSQKLKVLADSGLIGTITSVQQLSSPGYDAFAHGHVRGAWRHESESSFALLTAGIHDIDWLRCVAGGASTCTAVSSFAARRHFSRQARPKGATDRCLQCKIERRCPYSALKIYLDRSMVGERGWPLTEVAIDPTPQRVVEALTKNDYGRCVYSGDADVVDTQVVDLAFADGPLVSLTVTAFAPSRLRMTTVVGSLGQLVSDGPHVEHVDFLTDRARMIEAHAPDGTPPDAGSGELRLLQAFVRAASTGERIHNLSSPADVLESYELTFAAEHARRTGTVVDVAQWRRGAAT
jgi:predicted dehydrogenase